MSIQKDVLVKDTLSTFRSKMRQISNEAKPTEAQEFLCKAVVYGTVSALLKTAVDSIATFPVKTPGKNGIGLRIDSKIMVKGAVDKMRSLIGGPGGKALQKCMEGFMEPIASHFTKYVEVVPIGAFGGQALSPINMKTSVIEKEIISFIPPDKAKMMLSSKHGKNFIKAVSEGIFQGMAKAIPGAVPFGTTPPSPGKFSGKFI